MSKESDFVDLLNKEMYELKIADLEAKLAESEKKYAELFCRNIELETLYSQKTALLNFYKDTDIVEENQQFKEQLAEKDEESARAVIDANFKIVEERDKLKQQLEEKDKEYKSFKKIADGNVNYLKNRILEETMNYNQDKISFAVEQLELAQKYIKQYVNNFDDMNDCLYAIDNQIKELKEQKLNIEVWKWWVYFG